MGFGLNKDYRVIAVMIVVAVMAAGAVSASTVDGLVSYWPLDETAGNTAADVTGAHDGTRKGGAVWQSGKLGGCIDTKGAGYLTITEHADFRPAGAVSMQAWVSINSFSMWYGIAGNIQDNGSDESGYCMYTSSGGVDWYVAVNGRFQTVSSSATAGQWTHFVGTFDGSTVRLYKNGQLADSKAASGTINWSFMPVEFSIGRYHDDNENYLLNAKIDEVALWNRALTQEDVTFLYNGGAGTPVDNSAYVKITESGGNTVVTEGGEADSYEVALNTQPSGTVQVTATPGDGQIDIGNGHGNALVLSFSTTDWEIPQTVSVVASDDDVYEGKEQHKTTITHSCTGGEYSDINVSSVEVSVVDDELTCGDWGYLRTDLNRDCYVDLRDFAMLAIEWLKLPD